jgi:hypothetical protein
VRHRDEQTGEISSLDRLRQRSSRDHKRNSALAYGFGFLAAGRLLCGVGFVVSTLCFTMMIADWFLGRELATAMSVMIMSWPFGVAMDQIGHDNVWR